MNKWQTLIKYINDKPIGTIINRKDMRYHINNGPSRTRTLVYRTTDDNYRQTLAMLGVLETVKRGTYKILYHIRKDLSLYEAKKAAYSQDWRKWFNDFKETT